jgi:hypothetical protein
LTDGGISVDNIAVEEIWDAVDDGTPADPAVAAAL